MKKIILICTLVATCPKTQAQVTVKLQPHFNGHESMVRRLDSTSASWSGNPAAYSDTCYYDNLPILEYMAWTSLGCPMWTRTLLQFSDLTNTSVIPAGDTITNATLYLYGIPSTPTGDYGNSTYPSSPYPDTNWGWVYELAAPFDTAVTWNTQPDVLHTDSIAINPSTEQWGGNDTLNVTAIVEHMYTHSNYGFELRTQIETDYRERLFASSRYSDSTLHPVLSVTYQKGTGIKNINSENKFTVYPNPSDGWIQINTGAFSGDQLTVTISDVSGRILLKREIMNRTSQNNTGIDLSSCSKGLYFINVKNEFGSSLTQKLALN